MKVGLIGFARSGKTTVFNAITGAKAEVGAYGSREANVAVIKVPDARVDALAEIFKPKKKTYAEIEFIDIAPVEGTDQDKALDNAALNLLKNADALVHVVRAFENENVMHPRDSVNPERDVVSLEEELQLIVVRALADYFDDYLAFHGVRSRRSGNFIYIELFLEFEEDKKLSEVQSVIYRIKNTLEAEIPRSSVTIMPCTGKFGTENLPGP